MNTEKIRQDLQAILDQLPKPEPEWTPYSVVSKKNGKKYFLHQLDQHVGNKGDFVSLYFFAEEISEGAIAEFPSEYEIVEAQTGLPIVRKWTLPEPPPGQQWHRTDGWTREMLPEVTDGGLPWRPIIKGEEVITGGVGKDEYRLDCESDDFHWQAAIEGHKYIADQRGFWRTRRPLPAKPTYWSKPEHVPGPVCWLRKKGETAQSLVTYLDTSGLLLSESLNTRADSEAVLWGYLERFEHSTDRITWKRCTL